VGGTRIVLHSVWGTRTRGGNGDGAFLPQRVAGTSAGAITAALVAAGFSGAELGSLVLEEMKFKSFEDGGHWPVNPALQLATHKGLHPGK
jgi:NTE family protein